MKAVIIKHIFAYLSAAYFLVAGVGFNVVNYCCKSCENEGIEMVATDSCFAVHHHLHTKNPQKLHADLLCADIAKHADNCQFMRLNTDIPSFQAMNNLLVKQICTVYLFNVFSNFFAEKTELSNPINIPPPENYLSMSGRSILTFHSVLII
jgi:hypothetical protein